MKLLIALSEQEENDFLTARFREDLEGLPFEIKELRVPLGSFASWDERLRSVRPDALLAAWACPRLPDDLPVAREGSLRYVSYLAGSIRELVPRKLLVEGLLVTNWGGSISRTVAECGLLLILSTMRRAAFWSVALHRDGVWKKRKRTDTQSLFERRVGIHGFGNVARELVLLLKPFGVSVSAYSPGVPKNIFEEAGVRRSASLEHLFSENDVIVEVEAYHDGTRRIVTEDLLRSIPSGGSFVNIGRGEVVDEEALARVARDRTDDLQIGLDVYEVEPLPSDSPLRGLPNVALLPHIAGPTQDRRSDSTRAAIANLASFARGEPVPNPITPEKFDKST